MDTILARDRVFKTARRFFAKNRPVPGVGRRGRDFRTNLRAPLKIGIRRLFASGQSPTGKIFGGCLRVATLKSSCIGLFAHSLKIHPIEFLEIPLRKQLSFSGLFSGKGRVGRLFREKDAKKASNAIEKSVKRGYIIRNLTFSLSHRIIPWTFLPTICFRRS